MQFQKQLDFKNGDKVGNCIFIEEIPKEGGYKWKRKAKFKCECGKEFIAIIHKINSGHTKSCGCRNGEQHRMFGTPEYESWAHMKSRCYREKDARYSDYGGRGITVCDRWVDSFMSFFDDMGKRPSSNHSLDRINNELGYYKENCRWATKAQQNRNTRQNRYLTYNGKTQSMPDWCDELKLDYNIIRDRIFRGWTFERAIHQKIRPRIS